MIVYISVDGQRTLAPLSFPVVCVAEECPGNLRSGDYFISSSEKGRGQRLKRAFAYAFDVLGADGVITLPDGDLDETHYSRANEIANRLQEGADFVDGGINCKSPFWFGGLFKILMTFTTGSRRTPWCALRGYSKKMASLLASVKEKGAEYDTVVLQAAVAEEVKVTDLSSQTPQLMVNGNSPATFKNSFFGAWGIFMHSTSLKFLFSAVVAFLIDYVLLLAIAPLLPLGKQLSRGIAKILAWVCSSQTNFHLNRLLVFQKSEGLWSAMLQYYSLAGVVLIGKVVGVMVLSFVPLWLANLICEAFFFLFNYIVQKKLIFKKKK